MNFTISMHFIFVLHHVLLHIFTILSLEVTSRIRSEFAGLGMVMSIVALVPFTISMLVSFSFIFAMFSYYRRLKDQIRRELDNAKMATPIPLLPMDTNIYMYDIMYI